MKRNKAVVNAVIASLILITMYVGHNYLNEQNHWVSSDFLVKSYGVVFILNALFFLLFGIATVQFRDHLGFLYLFWVLMKFVLLFVIFYSDVNDNLETKKAEVISLLFPYLISIFLSAFPLSKELNGK